jgi:hypothetical protein
MANMSEHAIEGEPRPLSRYKPCRSIEEIFEACGGKHAVCRLTGQRYTAVCNWLALYDRIPPRYYLRIQNHLKRNGYIGNPALFGMA